jgi:protein-L-isoaspartate(D-aspartate) O-methyltransferase
VVDGLSVIEERLGDIAARYRREDRWAEVSAELDDAIAADRDLERAARAARETALEQIHHIPLPVPLDLIRRFSAAYVDVRRERFVLPDDIALSIRDEPVPLDARGHATVSAPHAYLLTDALLPLERGDRVLELGTGTGYGAAIARRLVGPTGHVTSVEVDPQLAARAARLLAERDERDADVTLLCANAGAVGPEILARDRPNRVAFTYAIATDPAPFLVHLPEGGSLVAPVGVAHGQDLIRFARTGGAIERTSHGGVRYVAERR